jgi:hypothetical protein
VPRAPVPSATGLGVLAVLTHDAVRLPCGIVLPATRAELPLTRLAPAAGATCLVGEGTVSWQGQDGQVVVTAVREWPVIRARSGTPLLRQVRAARAVLPSADVAAALGTGYDLPWAPGGPDAPDMVRGLLGRGPGLTPAGDDVLAGLLIGCLAFGVGSVGLRAAIGALAPAQTTALSAALLRHAARGECIGEVAAVTAALLGDGPADVAAGCLLGVGHTSGAALLLGLLLAAEAELREPGAVEPGTGDPGTGDPGTGDPGTGEPG